VAQGVEESEKMQSRALAQAQDVLRDLVQELGQDAACRAVEYAREPPPGAGAEGLAERLNASSALEAEEAWRTLNRLQPIQLTGLSAEHC